MAAFKLLITQVVFIWLNNCVLWQTGKRVGGVTLIKADRNNIFCYGNLYGLHYVLFCHEIIPRSPRSRLPAFECKSQVRFQNIESIT